MKDFSLFFLGIWITLTLSAKPAHERDDLRFPQNFKIDTRTGLYRYTHSHDATDEVLGRTYYYAGDPALRGT